MVARRSTRSTRSTRSKRGTKKKKFQYKRRTKEQYNRAASESSGNWDGYLKDGIQTFKPHDGQNQVRMLPPTFEGANDFAKTILVHYGIGADSATYLCLGKDDGCPMCEESGRLAKDGDSEAAGDFKAKKRKAVWLLDRKGDDPKKPLLWSMPFGTWQDLILVCKDEDGEVIYIDDPEEGCDVLFTKEGQGKKTRYTGIRLGKVRSLLKSESEQDDVTDYIMEHPIDDSLRYYDPEYLEGVLEGTVSKSDEDDEDDEDDDEDDDGRSSRSRKRRSSKKKSSRSRRRQEEEDDDDDDDEDADEDDEDGDEDDDEDEDEGEDEDEDEDEDEESDDDEDDEDEDEEEEDDEDEKPRRSRSRKSSGNRRLRSASSRSRKRTAKKTTRRRSR